MSLEPESVVNNTIFAADGDAFVGDKVDGDKICIYKTIIQQNVSLDAVKPILNEALNRLTEGKKDLAEQSLKMLGMLQDLSQEAKNSITALKITLGFEVADFEKAAIQQAFQVLSSNKQPHDAYQDIVNAATIILLKEQKTVSEIEAIYRGLPKGDFTSFSYLRSLDEVGPLNELPLDVNSANPVLLRVLLEKALAAGDDEASKTLLSLLRTKDLFSDLTQFEILVECIALNEFASCDYFLLTSIQKQVLETTCARLITYCQNLKVPDERMISIVAQLAIYTQFQDKQLMIYLEPHQHMLESMSFTGIEELRNCLSSNKASEYQKSIRDISDDALSRRIIDCAQEGRCSGTMLVDEFCSRRNVQLINKVLTELLALERAPNVIGNYCMLAACASSIIPEKSFPIRELENIFVDDLDGLNLVSTFIAPIAMKLARSERKELALIAFNLLFADCRPWLSDMYINYLSLLYENEQYHEVSVRLKCLTEAERENSEIVNLVSHIAANDADYSKAAILLEKELEKYQGKALSVDEKHRCVHLWLNLLNNVNQIQPAQIDSLVEKIPLSLFCDPDNELAWDLLCFFVKRFHSVEEQLLTWFFQDPNKYANRLFKVVFNVSQAHPRDFASDQGALFLRGYRYTENGVGKMRVLVGDDSLSNTFPQYLLSANGALAQKLSTNEKGGYFLYKAKHCIIQETLPPIIAANRIAVEIMDNDENECFSTISLPENLTYESLKEILDSVTGKDEGYSQNIKQILEGNFPINLKYNVVREPNNFGKALKSVLAKDTYFDMCIANEKEPQEVSTKDIVLDEVAFAFLSVTGLWQKLQTSTLHITIETEITIKSWLASFGESGIGFSKESNEFVWLNAEEVVKNFDLREEVESLLGACQVHVEKNYDVPLKFSLYTRSLLTPSTKSSLGLHGIIIGDISLLMLKCAPYLITLNSAMLY
ncbi:hypothetical protein [Photobacterium sanguinicancri]|uniref:hypothetical protein n=1 Tax=Photobacterium sanguinicancri TaxID=875932 RepID=UPI000789A0A8|nr:hypothetical protein [Photobacterium sanguinicancri]KXI21091.1 hypothetical protein AS132_20660 [Photobacterium sanguinicancri]